MEATNGRTGALEAANAKLSARQDDFAETVSGLRRDIDSLVEDMQNKVSLLISGGLGVGSGGGGALEVGTHGP